VQYSVHVESLAFSSYPKESKFFKRKSIKFCFLVFTRCCLSLMNTGGSDVSLWRLSCKFQKSERIGMLKVAVVDTNELKNMNDSSADPRIQMSYIKYQTLTVFKHTKQSTSQWLTACILFIVWKKATRLINWLELQFKRAGTGRQCGLHNRVWKPTTSISQ
jgi:hypothetical protein